MRLRVVARPQAEADIDEIGAYILEDSFNAAVRFLEAAEQAFDRLEERPQIGAMNFFADPRLQRIRFWPIPKFEKFLIFYQEFPDRIEILRVLHSARDIESIFEEEGPNGNAP